MAEDHMLERTNRVNLLFDFYGPLLTDKQQSILTLYYHDNFSLGEIASDLEVSRQAVYEHLKRAENILEEYEKKLGLAAQYSARAELTVKLEEMIRQQRWEEQHTMLDILVKLQSIEDMNEAE